MQIYRSREVGQSYATSVWTTLLAIVHALQLMIKIRPQVVLFLSFFFILSFISITLVVIHYLLCHNPRFSAMGLALVFLYVQLHSYLRFGLVSLRLYFFFSDSLSNLINSCRLICWDDNEVQSTLSAGIGD